jgi:hypothetical protein
VGLLVGGAVVGAVVGATLGFDVGVALLGTTINMMTKTEIMK